MIPTCSCCSQYSKPDALSSPLNILRDGSAAKIAFSPWADPFLECPRPERYTGALIHEDNLTAPLETGLPKKSPIFPHSAFFEAHRASGRPLSQSPWHT
jgi:hypothetical protein